MASLVIKFADLASEPVGSGRDVDAEVLVSYTREVPLTDGTVLQAVPMRKQLGPGGTAIFEVTPSDDPTVVEAHRDFGLRVEWLLTHRAGRGRQTETRGARTVKVTAADGATVQFGTLLPIEPVPAKYTSVQDYAAELTQVAEGAAADAGQALTEAQAARADADTLVDDYGNLVTLAQQAQAAALEVPDANVSALVGNPVTETSAALGQVFTPEQVDFARLVTDHQPKYTSMALSKVAANRYRVTMHDGTDGVIYQFVKDTLDDFIKLDACYAGMVELAPVASYTLTTGDLTGSWSTSTSTWYTTEVGATFTASVVGESVSIHTYRNPSGGMWSVTVDGGPPVNVTCWDSTATGLAVVTVASGLDPDAAHTVVGTFMGDDPAHPPSSTPSRGFIRNADSPVTGYAQEVAASVMVLADGSNKEMAFTLTSGSSSNWLPDHGVPSAYQVTAPQFYADGQPVDLPTQAAGFRVAASSVELRQHFTGRVDALALDVVEVRTRHHMTMDGLAFSGRFVATEPFDINAGYPLMMPGWGNVTDTFVTGALSTHVNTELEDYTYFGPERDAVHSGAVVSSVDPDVIAAATLANARLSMRRGAGAGKPAPGESLFVWNRATKPKMYWKAFGGATLAVGDSYSWAFNLAVARIPNVRSLISPA